MLLSHDAWLNLRHTMCQAGFPQVEQLGMYKLEAWPAPLWIYQVPPSPPPSLICPWSRHCLFICVFVRLSVRLSVCPSVCLSVRVALCSRCCVNYSLCCFPAAALVLCCVQPPSPASPSSCLYAACLASCITPVCLCVCLHSTPPHLSVSQSAGLCQSYSSLSSCDFISVLCPEALDGLLPC